MIGWKRAGAITLIGMVGLSSSGTRAGENAALSVGVYHSTGAQGIL